LEEHLRVERGPAMVLSEESVVGELSDVGLVVGDADTLKLPEDVGDVEDGVACYPFPVGEGMSVGGFPRWEGRYKTRDLRL
jgi:hypothetical protein